MTVQLILVHLFYAVLTTQACSSSSDTTDSPQRLKIEPDAERLLNQLGSTTLYIPQTDSSLVSCGIFFPEDAVSQDCGTRNESGISTAIRICKVYFPTLSYVLTRQIEIQPRSSSLPQRSFSIQDSLNINLNAMYGQATFEYQDGIGEAGHTLRLIDLDIEDLHDTTCLAVMENRTTPLDMWAIDSIFNLKDITSTSIKSGTVPSLEYR